MKTGLNCHLVEIIESYHLCQSIDSIVRLFKVELDIKGNCEETAQKNVDSRVKISSFIVFTADVFLRVIMFTFIQFSIYAKSVDFFSIQ